MAASITAGRRMWWAGRGPGSRSWCRLGWESPLQWQAGWLGEGWAMAAPGLTRSLLLLLLLLGWVLPAGD